MPKKQISYSVEEFGRLIRSSNLSNSYLEKALGFANGTIGGVLNGKKKMSDEKFQQLKHYIGLNHSPVDDREQYPILPPKFNPKVEEIKSSIEGLTTADKIPPPAPKVPEWVQRIEKYCSKEGISADDLIIAHKTLMSNFSPVEVKTSKIKDVVDNIKKATEKALESKESAAKFLSDAGITENKNSPKYDRRKVKLGF